jgi:predicted dehydrogenase
LGEVLRDDDIRAVLLTTPTPTHAELIERAARAGKAIFVEKPVASTLREAEAVLSVLRETGVPCQVGFQRRYDPAYAAAKRRIEAGELGRLETFRAISRDPFPPPLKFLRTSGGMLVDMGIHDFDSARFFMGEVETVYAVGRAVRDPSLAEHGLYDLAVALLTFESGALGTLENALNASYGYEIVADILGETGKFHLEKRQQTHLEAWSAAGVSHDYPAHFDERFPEAYKAEVVAFARNVLAGEPVSPDAEDATKSLRLALAAQHSLRTGRAVHVADFA